MAAPCARLQLVREPVRRGGVVRPLNSGVRCHLTNGFANALQQYREALLGASELASSHPPMYELHLETLGDIERRFAETADPSQCRLLVESARLIHPRTSYAGEGGERLRQAIDNLVSQVMPK